MRFHALLALLALAGCSAHHAERKHAMIHESPGIAGNAAESGPRLTIELLALDLATCGRCTGTEANLDDAIHAVADLLRETDVEVEVRKTLVKTAEQARSLRFESSPTIRINGRDIAFDLRESPCADCGDLCGCKGQIDCRVWVWRGRTHKQAPKALIIDAILRSYAQAWEPAQLPSTGKPFTLPENLKRFFDGVASASAPCCGRMEP
jgi:hypothetical protein